MMVRLNRPLPIAAAIAGALTAIGISVKLATTTGPLATRADEVLAREAELGDNFENLSSRIADLSEIEADPGFAKLPAGKRNAIREHLTELRAVASATDQLLKEYGRILDAGNLVLAQKNEPNLPARIRAVLASAESLENPEKDKVKPLPGSSRLTYAAIFQLAEIQAVLGDWKKLKEKLEPAARTQQQ